MEKEELKKRINEDVRMQGNEGAIALAPILDEIVDKTLGDGDGNDFVLHAINAQSADNAIHYEISDSDADIKKILDKAREDFTKIKISVKYYDEVLIFTEFEQSGDSLQGKLQGENYFYTLFLSEDMHANQMVAHYVDNTISFSSNVIIQLGTMLSNFIGYSRQFRFTYVNLLTYYLDLDDMPLVLFEYAKISNNGNYSNFYRNSKSKMIIPQILYGATEYDFSYSFVNTNAEIIDFKRDITCAKIISAFSTSRKLKYIMGTINLTSDAQVDNAFQGCNELLYFNISGLNKNLYLGESSKLLPETMLYLIDTSVQPTDVESFTITVHKDVLNNINNDSNWSSVKNALAEKTYIKIVGK